MRLFCILLNRGEDEVEKLRVIGVEEFFPIGMPQMESGPLHAIFLFDLDSEPLQVVPTSAIFFLTA